MPTELIDAGNALAAAFHASACLDDIPDVTVLGRYWGAGRRKAFEARDLLINHGLWISVRRDWNAPAEIRTAETRVTLRDLVELALECPTGTRIETAGCTWSVSDTGSPVLVSGDPTWPGLTPPRAGSTETGKSGGHDGYTDIGRTPRAGSTETGKSGGHDGYTDIGHSSRARSSSGPSGPSGGEEGPEGGTPPPPADAAGGASYEHDKQDWARLLARALPFSQKQGRAITAREARQLAVRFRVAAEVYGHSHEQVQQQALNALANSNGRGAARYVLGAFSDELLNREPVTESLSLPDTSSVTCGVTASTAKADTESAQLPPWCGECNHGEQAARVNPRLRYIGDPADGHMCSCHPKHPSRSADSTDDHRKAS